MSLIAELKRRNVFRVAAAYLALAWVVVQITESIVPALNLPALLVPVVVWIGIIGFPCVLLFSWVFELTPEGLRRESEIDRSQSITHVTGRRLDYITSALLVIAIAFVMVDRFVLPRAEAPPVDVARDQATGPGATVAEENRGQGPLPQGGSAAVAGAPDEKSIAVLPFVNMSEDKNNEYFSDGISEELLNLLAKIPELRVIARTSSFAYKGREMSIAAIARELNVAHVLEGSVRKAGNTVRITAQLVRAADSTHLWSETYDRPLDNIFAVQDEIAGSVVGQLKIKLLGAAPSTRVVDPKAYALYLRARQLGGQFTPEAFLQSNALYQQALAIEPDYPEVLRKLSVNYINEAAYGLRPLEEAYRMAREAIVKSLAVDPDFGRGHDGLGSIALNYDHDVAAAARHYEHALALDPTNLDILNNASFVAQVLGRVQQAIEMQEYVAARDPASAQSYSVLSYSYLLAGRYDEAIEANRTVLSLSPRFFGAASGIGLTLLLKGENEAALTAIRQEPSEIVRLHALAMACHALGQHSESDAALEQLISKYEQSIAIGVAQVFAFRGESDRAFEWLDKAVAYHDAAVSYVAVDPLLAPLHQDPRWLPLLRRLGLAPEQLAAIAFEVKLPK